MTHESCATKADLDRLRNEINDDIMQKYNEEELKIYNKGIEEGSKHAKPSHETANFIAMTDKRLELFSYRMKKIEEDIGEIKKGMKSHLEKFDTLLEKLDERYAFKETERSVSRIGWMVISAVIVALLALVIKK